jgi:hypothetical protein
LKGNRRTGEERRRKSHITSPFWFSCFSSSYFSGEGRGRERREVRGKGGRERKRGREEERKRAGREEGR